MTWDQKSHAIGGACPRYGPRCLGIAHFARQLAVAPGLAARNLPQRLPHAELEDGATQVEGIDPGPAFDQVCALADAIQGCVYQPRERWIGTQHGSRKLFAQAGLGVGTRPSERKPAETAPRFSHDHPAEGRGPGGPADFLALAALRKAGRGHAQFRAFIGTAWRLEPGRIDCIGHGFSLLQGSAQPPRPQRALILERAYLHGFLEEALHRERAQSGDTTQLGQTDGTVEIALNVGADLL